MIRMLSWQYSNYSKINPNVKSNFPFKNPRSNQLETISEIMEAVDCGFKYIVLESGTGTGKSAIAVTLANMFTSSYILTQTKQLQQQYINDFQCSDFNQVKGRVNFQCLNFLNRVTCDEGRCVTCNYNCKFSLKNQKIPKCEYYYQKFIGLNSKTVISNYHYLFHELNYVGDFKKRELLICDEAHNLEFILMNLLKLEFNRKDLKDHINFNISENLINKLNNGDYRTWTTFIEKIKSKYQLEFEKIRYLNNKNILNKISFIKNEINNCNRFIENIKFDPDFWIFNFNEHSQTIQFKPLKIDKYPKKMLFSFGDVCLFMSATILDYELFAKWIGLEMDEIYPIRKKSPFDIKKNPIIASNKYNLSKSSINVNAYKTLDLINNILEKHKNEKGLIHTISWQCKDFIINNIDNERFISHNLDNKIEQIEKFKKSKEALVFISPSMDEGINLPGDLCRFQIIYKIPFPDLGDKQIKIRSNFDFNWYNYQTSLRLIQTHGRGMRYENDYCKTYFIDNRLNNFVLTNNLIPDSFKDAITDNLSYSKEKRYLIEKGEALLKNNEYEKAIVFYKKLLNNELFKNDDYVYLKLSQAYYEIEDYEDEVCVILRFLNSHIQSKESVINYFNERLQRLDEMGYFHFNSSFNKKMKILLN